MFVKSARFSQRLALFASILTRYSWPGRKPVMVNWVLPLGSVFCITQGSLLYLVLSCQEQTVHVLVQLTAMEPDPSMLYCPVAVTPFWEVT